MKTTLVTTPVASFEDLVTALGASPEPRRKKATLLQTLLSLLVWMPSLMFVFLIVWTLCAAYWWGRYWDEVLTGILGLIQLSGL